MRNSGPKNEPLCETSEPGEHLYGKNELVPVSFEIGQRIMHIFAYQPIKNIVFRLKSTGPEIEAVLNGERLPTVELLLGIQKMTGASIDWILTGTGHPFTTGREAAEIVREPAPHWLGVEEHRLNL